ncbi:MAG: RHS repeat domain-containing protein [Candidatus Cryptobacteroides sp.]
MVQIESKLTYGSRANNNLPTFTKNRFRFNGKEEQTLNNSLLLDYGARMYDPYQCRWLTPDPLAEKYYHLSPYSFCANNPINFIDPDGKYIKYKSTNGELILEYNKNMKICD